MTTDLADRYGAPSRSRRPATIALAVVLAVIGLTWLAWTAWFHSTPDVSSELISFEVTDDHATSATLQVELQDGITASCRVRAYAEDHTSVGEVAFTPFDGNNEVVVRTERRATSVEKIGCTAPGQPRPR